MTSEHRRPLVAFIVVAIVCAVVLAHGIRTDAPVEDTADRGPASTAPVAAPDPVHPTSLPDLTGRESAPVPSSAPTPVARTAAERARAKQAKQAKHADHAAKPGAKRGAKHRAKHRAKALPPQAAAAASAAPGRKR